MKISSFLFISIPFILASCSGSHAIEVLNNSDLDRNEIVQVSMADIKKICGEDSFRLIDEVGGEVPYQVTYDNQLIFPAKVKSHMSASYCLESGLPADVDTLACGAFYPERKDVLAWENDKAAYWAYGPARQASDEHAYGYDIWTKSVEVPVVRKR